MGTAAKTEKKPTSEVDHLFEIMHGFENAVLMTKTMDGFDHLHGRPMRIAAIEEDHSVWFFVSIDSQTVRESQTDSEAYVVCQEGSRHVVLRGLLTPTKDKGRIDKYWSKWLEIWWPKGKDDPDVCLVKFTPREGEYWDTSGTKGVKYWLSAAAAFVTRQKSDGYPDAKQHGKVVV
jgi:general stress protein 26